jgi:Polyketide synthase dehydratase
MGAAIEVTVALDPTEPYLDHHRPGGDPLLGTVMSLDLALRTVGADLPERWRTGGVITNVEALRPVIVTGASATVTVRAGAQADGHRCAVETHDGDVVVHLTANIHTDEPGPALAPRQVELIGPVHAVDASEVYAVFFHGPAFRVIGRAWMADDAVVAELATGLPALRSADSGGPGADALPRLIEAGLQTAGLLDVASLGRMRIPSRIASIRWFGELSELDAPLFAVAQRSPGGQRSIDIDVVDGDGACRLRIRGYETLPLPFAAASDGVGRLSAAFRRTAPT